MEPQIPQIQSSFSDLKTSKLAHYFFGLFTDLQYPQKRSKQHLWQIPTESDWHSFAHPSFYEVYELSRNKHGWYRHFFAMASSSKEVATAGAHSPWDLFHGSLATRSSRWCCCWTGIHLSFRLINMNIMNQLLNSCNFSGGQVLLQLKHQWVWLSSSWISAADCRVVSELTSSSGAPKDWDIGGHGLLMSCHGRSVSKCGKKPLPQMLIFKSRGKNKTLQKCSLAMGKMMIEWSNGQMVNHHFPMTMIDH